MLYARVIFLAINTLSILGQITAQVENVQLEIGNKIIQFTLEEKMSVWRTMSDSIIDCDTAKQKKYLLGTNTKYALIPVSEFKTKQREIFDKDGCAWARLTNDEPKDDAPVFFYSTFLFDSINLVVRPASSWRHDTIMRINPITQREEQIEMIDSVSRVKFNLGKVHKPDLIAAIYTQLGLLRNSLSLRLKTAYLFVLTEKYGVIEIKYDEAKTVEEAAKKVYALKPGARIILWNYKLDNTDGRTFYNNFYDVAVMTLVE